MIDKKPLVSVVIFTYNQEDYIRETVEGAFAQTYSPLEIVISDDKSTDNNVFLIEDLISKYEGPHKIILNVNSQNLGSNIGEHVNVALNLTKGELIVLTGGDDISLPHRVETIYNEWILTNKKAKGLFSNVQLINTYGDDMGVMFKEIPNYTPDMLSFIKNSKYSYFTNKPLCWLLGCSSAIDRQTFEVFGDINKNVLQEDGVLAFRSLLLGEIKYIDKVLLKYRRHGGNVYDPSNTKKILYLLKREYNYKLQWYQDAKKINSNLVLMKILRVIVLRAYFYNVFLKIPFAGNTVLLLKNIVKKVISKK